jgi:NTP pyrophosphatase (non-canonical NTP hydrolase)
MDSYDDVRPEIKRFAVMMERKLQANDHKGTWKESSISYLFSRLEDEVRELRDQINSKSPVQDVVGEASDVANFAMMIYDVFLNKNV